MRLGLKIRRLLVEKLKAHFVIRVCDLSKMRLKVEKVAEYQFRNRGENIVGGKAKQCFSKDMDVCMCTISYLLVSH